MKPASRIRSAPGTVALEFALIGPPLIGLLLLIVQLGFLLYAQTALDYAVKETARQLQTGQQTVAAGTSQSALQTTSLCPYLSVFLSCSNVVLSLGAVTTFQTPVQPPPAPGSTVDAGTSGNLMLLQAYYTPSIPTWPLNITVLIGTAAYLNEF